MLWGAISFLFVISGFFVKSWMIKLNKDVDKIEVRLNSKVTVDTCVERTETLKKLFKHKHSKPGGEVIIP